jgi:hypothetical protein
MRSELVVCSVIALVVAQFAWEEVVSAPPAARKSRNDTQEIAKSFWSYFNGGLS